MPDALANRLALLQLAADLRQATAKAESVLDGGTAAEMLAASIALAHNIVSLSLLIEANGRDVRDLTGRAEAAELRMRRTLRGALRGLALDAANEVSRALRAKR